MCLMHDDFLDVTFPPHMETLLFVLWFLPGEVKMFHHDDVSPNRNGIPNDCRSDFLGQVLVDASSLLHVQVPALMTMLPLTSACAAHQVNHYLEDEYRIAHGFIYPEDYDIEQNEELLTAYGWPQETIDSPEFPGIIAEAVFESGEFQYDGEKEYTSFEEAAKIIGATIGVDVFSYILSEGGR